MLDLATFSSLLHLRPGPRPTPTHPTAEMSVVTGVARRASSNRERLLLLLLLPSSPLARSYYSSPVSPPSPPVEATYF
jgi:hypothetical protein